LASASVGTLEFRAVIEPIRSSTQLQFYEAACTSVDLAKNEIKCASTKGSEFTLPFDKLVIACGAIPKTFNIPGVKQHACFLKDIQHARTIRSRLIQGDLAYLFTLLNYKRLRMHRSLMLLPMNARICFILPSLAVVQQAYI
jgi:NADH dehydrogenase FAD-containing subunit